MPVQQSCCVWRNRQRRELHMKVRNILVLVLASLLLCTAVSAAEYTDVSDAHWAYKQINYLDAEITGYPDGTYKPENTVTRAEFLTLFARIAFQEEWKQAEPWNGSRKQTRK